MSDLTLPCKRLFGDTNCLLTNRRATENYLASNAIQSEMRSDKYAALDEFEKPNIDKSFWGKDNNWEIVAAMSKHEWLETDIGQFVGQMAANNLHKEGYLVRLGGNPVCCVNSRPLTGCASAFDDEDLTGAAVEFFFRAL